MSAITLHDACGGELRMVFETGLTVVSLLVAIGVIAVGFTLAGDPKTVRVWRTCGVGIVGGGGVSAMHYLGDRHNRNMRGLRRRLLLRLLRCCTAQVAIARFLPTCG